MLEEFLYPDQLLPEELDELLGAGWFRVQQAVFTTHFIFEGAQLLPVFWLRYPVQHMNLSSSARKLARTACAFDISVRSGACTAEQEKLYQLYRASLPFPVSPSLADLLQGDRTVNVFHTKHIEIRLAGKLIASGIYDEGNHSIAGIVNFFDPAFRKFSMGKLLMILKLHQAGELNKQYYYPGYISTATNKFDYKLFLDPLHAEVYIPLMEQWVPYPEALQRQLMRIVWRKRG